MRRCLTSVRLICASGHHGASQPAEVGGGVPGDAGARSRGVQHRALAPVPIDDGDGIGADKGDPGAIGRPNGVADVGSRIERAGFPVKEKALERGRLVFLRAPFKDQLLRVGGGPGDVAEKGVLAVGDDVGRGIIVCAYGGQ